LGENQVLCQIATIFLYMVNTVFKSVHFLPIGINNFLFYKENLKKDYPSLFLFYLIL